MLVEVPYCLRPGLFSALLSITEKGFFRFAPVRCLPVVHDEPPREILSKIFVNNTPVTLRRYDKNISRFRVPNIHYRLFD